MIDRTFVEEDSTLKNSRNPSRFAFIVYYHVHYDMRMHSSVCDNRICPACIYLQRDIDVSLRLLQSVRMHTILYTSSRLSRRVTYYQFSCAITQWTEAEKQVSQSCVERFIVRKTRKPMNERFSHDAPLYFLLFRTLSDTFRYSFISDLHRILLVWFYIRKCIQFQSARMSTFRYSVIVDSRKI